MSKNALRYPEDDYLRYDPYEGDEAEIRCRTTKLVRSVSRTRVSWAPTLTVATTT
jgi:hypothetical protein